MEQLSAIIRTENPLQLKFPYALWTLAMIRELIRERFSVALSEVSVGRLMRRLGFSAQRPLYRASQQDAVLVERWQAEVYPQLVARAKKENALIFFADEAGMRSDHHAGTTWSPVGNTPEYGVRPIIVAPAIRDDATNIGLSPLTNLSPFATRTAFSSVVK